jgi:hypothetical protein
MKDGVHWLLRFLVLGVLLAALAVLVEGELFLGGALVLGCGVIALLADTAFQADDRPIHCSSL